MNLKDKIIICSKDPSIIKNSIKEWWRSCRKDNIISINKVITEEELFGKSIEF